MSVRAMPKQLSCFQEGGYLSLGSIWPSDLSLQPNWAIACDEVAPVLPEQRTTYGLGMLVYARIYQRHHMTSNSSYEPTKSAWQAGCAACTDIRMCLELQYMASTALIMQCLIQGLHE